MRNKTATAPRIAHRIPNRMRIKLPQALKPDDAKALLQDLQVSPHISKATLNGTSLIIEHSDDEETVIHSGNVLSKMFPGLERWSNTFDAEVSKIVADPWVNKTIPLGFIGLAVYAFIRDGALMAGESAFAMGYIAFDVYWKFQQENVIRKIEKGMSKQAQANLEESGD